VPVATAVGVVREGMAEAKILKAYPDLEVDYVRERRPTRLRPSANETSRRRLTLDLHSIDYGR
jgi:hypothetical protein